MKLTSLDIKNVVFSNITLNNAGFLKFYDVETVTIKNVTLANITCNVTSSASIPFLLDF